MKKRDKSYPGGVPILRTLTRTATLKFGQFADFTIAHLFELHQTDYLRWVYYNMNGISFTADILYDLKIWGENFDHRIPKPGTQPEPK